ncbi:MFS general substrate transporter [Irpex rosettiformis]|uniref:MFS general substrate transporter n=1 Tax=Irpex rosettiformis TaxID=378272 RepID=A0ACB8TWS9_9APHY|nr:MFS general substrate transporter [Irpex rosettiformis]
MATSEVELTTVNNSPLTSLNLSANHNDVASSPQHINETSLAPVDSGFGAWSFLAAASCIEMIVWGFPNAYGVFLIKYLDDPHWSSQRQASFLLPLVGPLSSGIMYCAGPITYPLVARYPRHRRTCLWLGAVCVFASLLGASYARSIAALVALQGALYAVGGVLLYAPTIYYMSEWFVARRGLASGAIDAGTALGGLLLPLILPPLLNKYDTPKMLRSLGIAEGIVLVLTLPFIRGRPPESRVQGPSARAHQANTAGRVYTRNKSFWIVILVTLLQGLAYFTPLLWLSAYASSLHLSSNSASLALAFLNGASVVGRLSMGILSDRFNPWMLASVTLLSTAFSVFVLWGVLSYTFTGIVIYGIAYGCLAGGYSSLWTGFVRPIAKDDPTMSTTIFGFLMLSRGICNILSTPISTAMQPSQSYTVSLQAPSHHEIGLKLAGGQYKKVIIYAGTCFVAAAAVVAVGWIVERRHPSSINFSRR